MEHEEITYENALQELTSIQQALENQEIPIEQIAEKVKRARRLLQVCRSKLREAEEEINKALEE